MFKFGRYYAIYIPIDCRDLEFEFIYFLIEIPVSTHNNFRNRNFNILNKYRNLK